MHRARPDVSAVVVHFETPDVLARCLDALRASAGVALEAIVVDNASPGFAIDQVERHFPGARAIANQTNEGFAVAANQGLRVGRGRYLLLLNADTIVEPDTIAKLVAYLDEHPRVGCATARLNLEDGSLDLACRRLFPTPERALYRMSMLSRLFPRSQTFAQYNLTYLPEDRETEIDAPCGAFMMVRAEIRESVGLLDERYFMYGEDLDWAYRIKRAGWKNVYYPEAVALHLKGASSAHNRPRSIRAFYEAMRIFYGQHYASRYPRLLSWLIYRAIDVRERVELLAARA
ncbi:MAG TPA: glycosyltransferase family 2 protein [Candidatus Limnocylindrales bacterium]|nr:glycosyltransferase family 2 protein [Candidatus Limnocylindrales bacterium]